MGLLRIITLSLLCSVLGSALSIPARAVQLSYIASQQAVLTECAASPGDEAPAPNDETPQDFSMGAELLELVKTEEPALLGARGLGAPPDTYSLLPAVLHGLHPYLLVQADIRPPESVSQGHPPFSVNRRIHLQRS